ncbi:ROK family protein [Pseudomonas sp. CCOS 191]|uniref:ROK family protein n=1 Tax=Pseudomonas sp. CCOS 191 TaxID=1649877 RepID=UPI000624BB5E|nr:ROK family protein [Pseudomonas sp. CCOS 191]CRI58546.1 hypothetical protein CCOS191_4010 [Pseudomonas sp. CCOS 191]
MHCASVDLGGSKIALCFSFSGRVMQRERIEIPPGLPPQVVLEQAKALIESQILLYGPISTLVIASAPTLNADGSIIRWPNRPDWEGVALAHAFRVAGVERVIWCDDGTAATYGDATVMRASNLLHLSLGTGVGGGVVYQGRILPDRELGHLLVWPGGALCSCGRFGCLQAYASFRSLDKFVASMGFSDDATLSHWRLRAVQALALAVANLVELFRVEVVCLGGGLLGRFPEIPQMIGVLLREPGYLKPSLTAPLVMQSPQGTEASLLGGLYLAEASHDVQNEICEGGQGNSKVSIRHVGNGLSFISMSTR